MAFLGRVFWIDTQAGAYLPLSDFTVCFQLGDRVEDDVVANFDKLGHLLSRISRGKHMIFDAGTHFLMGQARFIQAACRGAGQIFRYERVDPEHRKGH